MAINMIGNSGAQTPTPAAAQRPAQGDRTPPAKPELDSRQQPPKPEQVQNAVKSLEQLVKNKAPNSLAFSIDDNSGKTVVRVSDAKTGEMIRQIPSEEMLELARSLDKMQGMLLKQEA